MSPTRERVAESARLELERIERETTAETPTMRDRLAQASWKSDGVTLPYPWHAISWEDAPDNEKQPHFDSVDAILRKMLEPSEADVHVSELAKGPDMRQDLDPEEVWQLRKWWVQSILNETKD